MVPLEWLEVAHIERLEYVSEVQRQCKEYNCVGLGAVCNLFGHMRTVAVK
jgi:hypothetical protein